MATITQTPYGTYTHGVPRRSEGAGYRASWYRVDTWTPTRGEWGPGWGSSDRLRCAGRDDDSPMHLKPYVGDCACCWLHHPHTSAAHEQHLELLARAREAQKNTLAIP